MQVSRDEKMSGSAEPIWRGFQNIKPYADTQHTNTRAGGGRRSRAMLEPRLVVQHKGRGKGVYSMVDRTSLKKVERDTRKRYHDATKGGEKTKGML